MGMTACKECQKAISDKAAQCPHCGYKPSQSGCIPVLLFAAFMSSITSFCDSKKDNSSNTPISSNSSSISNSTGANSDSSLTVDVTPLTVRNICAATISVIFRQAAWSNKIDSDIIQPI